MHTIELSLQHIFKFDQDTSTLPHAYQRYRKIPPQVTTSGRVPNGLAVNIINHQRSKLPDDPGAI